MHQMEQAAGKKSPKTNNSKTIQTYLRECKDRVSIPQKLSYDLQTTLGLDLTIGKHTEGAEKKFMTRNGTFGYRILSSKLQPNTVSLALQTVHIPGQQYRFHGAQFEQAFLTKESNRTTSAILPKMMYAATHHLALRYAPLDRGNLELPHY